MVEKIRQDTECIILCHELLILHNKYLFFCKINIAMILSWVNDQYNYTTRQNIRTTCNKLSHYKRRQKYQSWMITYS